eukprot:TRINITY_DN44182_c0_g1_i2.p1 TRINITY_DN44182_c0_g1~~TRINITY_DN44182_c0_g1_i2.p1  ORF type:complete len:106 (-),score=8.86 TRINITY_DN44182_c0_g1_i2:20-337(-)
MGGRHTRGIRPVTRRAAEVKLFSTSFLDLLFCALRGVLVLWVLTGRSEPPFPDTAYGFFRLSQGGVNHIRFCEVRLLETNELIAGWRHAGTQGGCSDMSSSETTR